MFTQKDLIEIRSKAYDLADDYNVDSAWKRAYFALGDAANNLHAFIARTSVGKAESREDVIEDATLKKLSHADLVEKLEESYSRFKKVLKDRGLGFNLNCKLDRIFSDIRDEIINIFSLSSQKRLLTIDLVTANNDNQDREAMKEIESRLHEIDDLKNASIDAVFKLQGKLRGQPKLMLVIRGDDLIKLAEECGYESMFEKDMLSSR